MPGSTISARILDQVNREPDNPAISGLDLNSCTYHGLITQMDYTHACLNDLGITKEDAVAVVLPNGPLMASTFLSIASHSSCAPLNPRYTASEFEFYLSDLAARLLVVLAGSESPAIQVAGSLGIEIAFLQPSNEFAGRFTFSGFSQQKTHGAINPVSQNDIALILHTSGTTSRPKMVPLTQKNLVTSALNISRTLELAPEDCCLNIMPLFHIHGLMASILATVVSGASVACMPGFFAPQFFGWVKTFDPTWFSAVPSMHQSILSRSRDNQEIIRNSRLRFIRSSSASLPPSVMTNIEQVFEIPLIEAYGMTEASHQMACNPLPPGVRKPGSVGLPAGPEIRIMDEQGPTFLTVNTPGEIVIRGDNVTLGYLNNKEANNRSFSNGWFRTGDQGYFDEDGYLFIKDRLKEVINRGGEKISPKEVDEVLLRHPAVSQALAFSVPDPNLGEDIAAVVVLSDPGISEMDLKLHAAEFLAPHKVPAQIIVRDEIPKGPTGKLQRIGLAEKLGLSAVNEKTPKAKEKFIAPGTEVEKRICKIWREVLDVPKVGIKNRFRDLGGDSILATLIFAALEEEFQVDLALVEVYAAATIAEQAKLIENKGWKPPGQD